LNERYGSEELQELMKEAGKLIGIKVLDHLIVSHMGYSSIKQLTQSITTTEREK